MKYTALLLLALIVAVSAFPKPEDDKAKKARLEYEQRRQDGNKFESYKYSQDTWVSRDGNWRAGGYAQHDRFNNRGAGTHAGFQLSGRF